MADAQQPESGDAPAAAEDVPAAAAEDVPAAAEAAPAPSTVDAEAAPAASTDPNPLQALRDQRDKLKGEWEQLNALIAQWHASVVELQQKLAQDPRTWTQYNMPDGRPYWVNSITGMSQWEQPQAGSLGGPPKPRGTFGQREGHKPEGPPGSNLFVLRKKRRHEVDDFYDEDLHALFAPYGKILRADLTFEQSLDGVRKSKGFGFVSFDNPESATAAINAINGTTVRGYLTVVERQGSTTGAPNSR